ncbi:hypothetical protein EON81_12005 [bacterium]|nr:MAG: hypothetical protein EON81_12005 [bacterium]
MPRTSEHWIVLAEGYRDFALRLEHADIAIKDLPRTIPDLVITPAPRIHWLLSLPHESYIDPLYVSLK